MGTEERGFGVDPELRPVVWRVMRAGGLSGGKPGIPAGVSHVVPPAEPGSQGVAAVAGAQHGLVTRSQLVALGFSAKAIEHRVRTGALHRLYRGVFAVGHLSLAEPGRAAAALL